MTIIKRHEFHVLNMEGGTDHLAGTVKCSSDLRIVDGYFQVFSVTDPEVVIGIRADKVDMYSLIPITEEVNHNAT